MRDGRSAYHAEQLWSPTSESILTWDEAFHDLLVNDRLRTDAYRKAIFEVVRPGDHVVDLGVGTGILSLWALQAGAGRVTGIEMNQEILSRALDLLARAGHGDRFVPVNRLSTKVELEPAADVLISEIIGNMADNESLQPILEDAAARFLKPGGRQIPEVVTSYIVPVSATSAHRDLCDGKIFSLSPKYDVRKADRRRRRRSPFDLYYDCILPEHLYLGDPQQLRRYGGRWDQAPTYDAPLSCTLTRQGRLTGFKAYFVAQLSPRTRLDISGGDIAAGKTSDSWKHAYLPIEEPVDVQPGDVLDMTFSRRSSARPGAAFQQAYQWCGTISRHGAVVGRFSQRTG